MRRKPVALLALVWALCLIAAGCAGEGSVSSQPGSAAGEENHTPPSASVSSEEHEERGEAGAGIVVPGQDAPNASGTEVPVTAEGKVRITYTGNRSSVRYITSAEALPDYTELEQFDDAYFAEHALVLVTETVNSGSVDVGILSVNTSGSTASVTLYHEVPEDGATTDDMATWLLWAEVEPGLDCQWAVENPALPSDTVTH